VYRYLRVPQVVAGFTPEHVLNAILMILEMVREQKMDVLNCYQGAVKERGNVIAQELLKSTFYMTDSEWRGMGRIKDSGLEVRNMELDAKRVHHDILKDVPVPAATACSCGDVLAGRIGPKDCPLFGKVCTPDKPQGACMVSSEGACGLTYKYT
jgi:hydrogenase expression/formation protein HypD